MAAAYIALGSNLLAPRQQIESALLQISLVKEIVLVTISPFYRSIPFGIKEQPDFLNAVAKIETTLTPVVLLATLQKIENDHGRIRNSERFGPRTLDLDILLYDNYVIESAQLTLPHYAMRYREFVLYPLCDIAPDLTFPDGKRLTEIIKNLPKNNLTYWSDSI